MKRFALALASCAPPPFSARRYHFLRAARAAVFVCAASLASCSTPQVQDTCAEMQRVLQVAQPFLVAAPPEVRVAVMAIGAGTVACGTPQYAEMRERVIAWLRSRGARI